MGMGMGIADWVMMFVQGEEPVSSSGHGALENGHTNGATPAADIEMGSVPGVHERVNGEAVSIRADKSSDETLKTSSKSPGDAPLIPGAPFACP